jgi:hypothetical protein
MSSRAESGFRAVFRFLEAILRAYAGTCPALGSGGTSPFRALTPNSEVDHLVELAAGETNDLANLASG